MSKLFRVSRGNNIRATHYISALIVYCFNFLLQQYISKLGEISNLNWGLLFSLVLLNYFRIRVIDPNLRSAGCGFVASDLNQTGPYNISTISGSGAHGHSVTAAGQAYTHTHALHRYLSTTEEIAACPRDILAYAFVLCMILSLFIMSVFIAACHYYDTIIGITVKEAGADWETHGRSCYASTLSKFRTVAESTWELMQTEKVDMVTLAKQTADEEKLEKHKEVLRHAQASQKFKLASVVSGLCSFSSRGGTTGEDDDREQLASSTAKVSKKILNHSMNHVFVSARPSHFFKCVESALFLQCVYISLCLTQLLPLAVEDTQYTSAWCIAFILPMIVNFFILQQTLHKSVQIQSVVQLDKSIFSQVCEDCAYEKEAVDNMGARMRRKLVEMRIEKADWITCIRQIFNGYDKDGSLSLDKVEFLSLLGNLDIFMTDKSFDLLWECLDFDMSGKQSTVRIRKRNIVRFFFGKNEHDN